MKIWSYAWQLTGGGPCHEPLRQGNEKPPGETACSEKTLASSCGFSLCETVSALSSSSLFSTVPLHSLKYNSQRLNWRNRGLKFGFEAVRIFSDMNKHKASFELSAHYHIDSLKNAVFCSASRVHVNGDRLRRYALRLTVNRNDWT